MSSVPKYCIPYKLTHLYTILSMCTTPCINDPMQGDWDPFGDLPTASKPQTPELSSKTADHPAGIRPARAAPPPPKPTANPFGQLSSSSAISDDPFAFLSALHTAGHNSNGTTEPLPPGYDTAVAADSVAAPPSYDAAAELSPPPAYDAATVMPPPPTYEEAVAPATAATISPARAAPAAPAAARGPLHAGMPSRPAPPAPVPLRPAPAAPVPARAAPAPPQPARPAPSPPAASPTTAAVTADDMDWLETESASTPQQQQQQHVEVQQQLHALQLSGAKGSSSALSSSYANTGNVGAVPRGAASNGHQVGCYTALLFQET